MSQWGHNDEPPYENQGLSNFMQQLWECDENRLVQGTDYQLDIGGRTRYSFDGPDEADDPLFTWVKPEVFQRPTYKAFMALLDNYESDTGVPEVVTDQELAENQRFINLVFESKPMQLAYRFLKYKGKATDDVATFRRKFYNMWFKLYRRSRESRSFDSSGFEHVFVGETRQARGNKEVIGFHNWIQFYLQEKAKKVDYKGFMSSTKNPHLLTVQFSWQDEVKPKGSMMIGISPEFEIAMYTVCYLMGHESYKFSFDGDEIVIKCHQMAGKIGSCYPQLPSR